MLQHCAGTDILEAYWCFAYFICGQLAAYTVYTRLFFVRYGSPRPSLYKEPKNLTRNGKRSLHEVGAGLLRVNDMDIIEQEQTQTELRMLSNLTREQLRLVAAWLHEEATLRATWYSQEVCESIRYMGHRLEILAKD